MEMIHIKTKLAVRQYIPSFWYMGGLPKKIQDIPSDENI